MIELVRSDDPVLISFVTSILTDAGIEHRVADAHMSVIDGSIGAITNRILDLATRLARLSAAEPHLILQSVGSTRLNAWQPSQWQLRTVPPRDH